jgi:hypothetical protein
MEAKKPKLWSFSSCLCSGAQGEYAGLATIRAYLDQKGERHRTVRMDKWHLLTMGWQQAQLSGPFSSMGYTLPAFLEAFGNIKSRNKFLWTGCYGPHLQDIPLNYFKGKHSEIRGFCANPAHNFYVSQLAGALSSQGSGVRGVGEKQECDHCKPSSWLSSVPGAGWKAEIALILL